MAVHSPPPGIKTQENVNLFTGTIVAKWSHSNLVPRVLFYLSLRGESRRENLGTRLSHSFQRAFISLSPISIAIATIETKLQITKECKWQLWNDEKLQERIQTERKYLQKWCEPWTKLDGKRYGTDDCMNFTEILLLWTLEQKWFYINDENLQK